MYNQGNMHLHLYLFIKYVSNNVYSDNNHGQPQSILNIFLTFFSSLGHRYYFLCFSYKLVKKTGSVGRQNKNKL